MSTLYRITLFLILCISLTTQSTAQPASSAECPLFKANSEGMLDTDYFDATLDDQIAEFLTDMQSVAGLAIAVVHENRIIYLRGFGYRNRETCIPVLPDTRFYLKSTTKSFLGVLAALLHEEGHIELDAPITEYLPTLSPPGINASQLTIRQHLTHGIPYFDGGLNYQSAYVGMDEAAYVEHVNTYARSKDTRFQYSNFGPIIAAHAISTKMGINWRDLMEKNIFKPLGMTSSATHVSKAMAGPIAQVYILGENKHFEPTVLKKDSQMHAAGGAFSSAEDMSKWLIASLNDGLLDGNQVIPSHAFQQAHARQINLDWTYYKFRRFAHGFGHYSADYEGDLLMHHFGGETHFSFMPKHKLGVIVLSNQIHGGSLTTHRLAALLYDILLDKKNIEERWKIARREIIQGMVRIQAQKEERVAQLRSTAPTHPTPFSSSQLAGYYINKRIGAIKISVDSNEITMEYGAQRGNLDHITGNAYLADFNPWGQPPVRFVFETDESSDKMHINWDGRIFTKE